jgi:hypothetical protein
MSTIYSWLIKNAVIILLVVVGLFALDLFIPKFNPISGLFKAKTTITNTSLDISDVNDIGELITAEYHGEVISSLTEFTYKTTKSALELKYNELRTAATGITAKSFLDKMKNNEEGREWLEVIREIAGYHDIAFLYSNKHKKFINEVLKEESWDSFEKKYQSTINGYYDVNVQQLISKKELYYLGRGIVTAGFDLESLNVSQFKYNGTRDTLLIVNLDPEILNYDINPYYQIPPKNLHDQPEEEPYYGFSVLKKSEPIFNKLKFEEINNVKIQCRDNLKKAAIKRKILAQAKSNGDEVLTAFFTLWEGDDSDPKTVRIINTRYFEMSQEILADLRIDTLEMEVIEAVVANDILETNMDSIRFESIEQQIDQLESFVAYIDDQSIEALNDMTWEDKRTSFLRTIQDAASASK